MADVELLFGVEGGGSVSSGSGALIKSQLDAIINAVNSKPFEIKVKLDTKELDKIKKWKSSGLDQIVVRTRDIGKEGKKAAKQFGDLSKGYKSFITSEAKTRWELKELDRTRSSLISDTESARKNSVRGESKRIRLLTKDVSALSAAMEQVIGVDEKYVNRDQRKAISSGVTHVKKEINELKKANALRAEASKKAMVKPTRLMQDLKSARKELTESMTALSKVKDSDLTKGRLKTKNKLQSDYGDLRDKFVALDNKVITQTEKNINGIIKETQAMKARSAALVEYVANKKQLAAIKERDKSNKRKTKVEQEFGEIRDTKNLLKRRFNELANIDASNLTPKKLDSYKQAKADYKKYQSHVIDLTKGRIASTNENIAAVRKEGNALKETTRQILAYNKAKIQKIKAKEQAQYNKERPGIEQDLKDLKAQESDIGKNIKVLDDSRDISKTKAEIDALKKLKQAQRDYNIEVQGVSKGYTEQTHGNIADIYKRGEALQKEAASWVKVKNARVEAAKADVKGNELVEKGLPVLKKNLADTERLLTTKIDNSTAAKKSHDSQIRGWYKDLVTYKNQVKALRAEAESLGKDNQLGGVDKANKFNRITADLSKLKSETSGVMANLHDAGKDVKAFGSGFGGLAKKFASWLSVSQVVMAAYNGMKRMVVAVRDVDTAMTELKKVTDETDASYDQFLEKSVSRSKQLGASLSDTISASADFARLGYSLSEASDLADAAMIYKNVGDGIGSVEEASSSIISTMKAFGIETSDVMSIVDKFNAVGNNFAISSKGIGDALLRSASSLASANNTLDESIALITAANATVQDTDKVGTSLKTVSMFLRAAKTEAIDAGESTEGMAESVSKLRQEFLDLTGGKVDIQLDDDTFKSTYQIIKEIAGVWDELTDITQANILERMGGKRNSNVVASMIENFQIAEDVMKTAGNSAGSALAENEKYLDSINGKVAQFKATFEEVSVDLIDSESVKLVIDMGTGLLNIVGIVAQLVSALGGLKNILGAIAAYKAGKNLFELGKHLKVALNAINSAGSTKLVPYGQHVGKVSAVLGEMSNSMDKVGKSASKMKIAMTALGSIGTIIGIIATAYYSQKERINAENQKAASNAELLSKDLATLDSYKQRASALQDSLNTGNLSMQEAYNARKELVGIQQELVDMYGQEAQGIDLVTGKINGQIAALSQSGWEQFKHENSDAINRATNFFNGFNMGDAVKGIDKLWARDGSLQIYIPEYSSKGTNITEQLKKAGERNADAAVDSFYSEIESGLKSLDITIPDNALGIKNIGSFSISDENFNSPYEALHFYEQLYDIMDKAGRVSFGKDYNNYIGETLSQYSEIISNIKNQIGDYEPIFNQYAEGLLASDDIYSDIWGKALAARQKYDDAVLSGDQAAIDSAIIEMKDIETAFSNSNSKWDASAKLYAERFFNAFAEETAQRQIELDIKTDIDKNEFSKDIDSAIETFADESGKIDVAKVLNVELDPNSTEEQKTQYEVLSEAATKYGTTVEGLLGILSKLGRIELVDNSVSDDLIAEYTRLETAVANISSSSETVNKALAEQGKTGVLSLDTYKSLIALGDDYTDCLEWNGKSLAINEDKMNSLNESMIEATKAEIELARAQDVQKWNENRAEIEKLITTTDEWDDATLGTLNTLKATNEQLASNIEQYGILASQLDFATSGYKKWMDAQSAPTTGQAFNGVQGAVADLEEGFKTSKLNTPKYKAALDFVIPEEIQEDGVDAVRQYVAKLNEIVGKEAGVQGMLTFLDKAVNQELMEFVDNEYRVKEGITTDDFAKKLTMTRDVVLAIFGELEEYDDFHFSFVDEDPTAALQSIQKLLDAKAELINAEHQYGKDSDEYRDAQEDVNKYAEAVNNLPDSVKTEVGLETDEELTPENISEQLSDIDPVTISAELRYDVEKNDIQKQIEDYRHAFAEMQDAAKQKIDVTPYAEKVNAIRQQLEALPPAVQAAFNIDTTLFDHGIASISETIEDYKVALANLGKAEPDTSAYTEAEAKVEELRGAIEELPEEVRIAAGIDLETLDAEIENDTFELKISPVVAEADTSQILLDIATAEERISALESTPIALTADITDVTTKLGEIEQKIQGLAESLNINLDVNTTWTPNATPGNTKLPSLEPVSTTATVDTSQAMTAIETLKAAIASVKDKLVKVIAKVSGIQSVNALRNSIANTHGKTVVIRTIHRDEYQASGVQQFNGTDGPSKESGIFLGGEVGRELVVDPRSGTWHTIGDRGAEFFSLRKGQIVFNAKQTEQLLSSGRTLGRGRVMVNGNAGNAAVGGAGNPIIVGGLGQPSYDSTHANKVVNKIKDTIKDISKDVGKETGDAAKKTEEAFKKMIASVEHEIFLMEKNHADPQEIIKVYQNLQKSVHDMAEQYRAKGEQANAEHIEELQKQWWKYADAIESIRKETFEKMTSRAEHEIFLMEKNNADPRDIIKIYQGLQEATHDMAEGYRARGEEENAEHIEELQKQWWEYAEAIEDVRKKTIDEFVNDADFMVEALEKNDSSVDRITNTYSAALKVIQGEIDHYISNGYDITDEVVQDLLHKIWEVEDNAQSALHKAVDKANEAVGDVLNVYDTLNGAADEYAEFGFITVERLQDIIGLGVEYMAFLQDENGQLVINKESIQNVVAARAEQLAVESALSYVEQLRLALDQGNEIELQRLLTATTTATNATWGLVYANLALLDLNGDQFAAALHNINALRSLADNAISNVSHSIGGLHKQEAARRDESLHKQKDALDKLLDYVMELVKWEAEHKIEALEEQIDDYRKIIDLKKESLRATKDELDYEDELKDRVSKIADLQARIAILALDDSRSAQQERIKLEEQLAEAQKEVADKQSDHMLEKHEDALDDMADAYEKEKQKEIDAVKETISSTEKIYRLAIDRINNHWDTLYKDLINYNYEYGSHIEKDIIEAWNNASEAVKKYGGYLEAVSRIESEIKHSESIKNNEGMNSIIGGSTQHDTSGINENTAKLIVERMKANSVAYSGSNNNPEMQQSLADENVKLASKLSELLGANVVRDENGVWFIDGERLYDKYSALGGYNANPGQELANPQYSVAKAMVDKMKENGAKWATYAGDKAMQDKLAQENEKLAQRLSEYLGVEIKKDGNGVWLINGEKLFDKYHTGGIVGHRSSLRQDEMMAVLQKGEAVLDKRKENAVIRLMDFANNISKKIDAVAGRFRIEDINRIDMARSFDTKRPNVNESNRCVSISFGDVNITGTDKETIAEHKRINRKFTNEILEQLKIRK